MTEDRPTQAVILAGGRGTRLRPLTDLRPKPMIRFHGKPFLEYVIEMLADQGFHRVLLLLGYLPDEIRDHFGDGSDLGVEIEYDVTAPEDLTARRVQHASDRLDDVFLLLYCDNYWPMRFGEMWEAFRASGAPAQITVYGNRDDFTDDSVRVGEDGRVEVFDRSRTSPGLEGVEISYALLRKDAVLPLLPERQELFEEAVYPALTDRGELRAFRTDHRYYSVGDHARLPLTEKFLRREPAVILDRDGVLNERPPKAEYVEGPDQFAWLPGAREALRRFQEEGWRVIVVTNQAGIARGMMTEEDLHRIHRQMHRQARAAGGRIEAVYYCPHGWDEGCDCRKPRPGMLLRAQRDFHLDLTRTFFVGDDERDAEAARAAGSPWALVDDDEAGLREIAEMLLSGELTPAEPAIASAGSASAR